MSASAPRVGSSIPWQSGLAAALYLAGLWTMFGHSITAHASIGDNGDGTILIAVLEHWFGVFTGRVADWQVPGWYWPAPHTLGYMDSLFLLALPYGAARWLGAGWFVANDITVWTFATIGFWSMVALTRRLGVPVAIGAVAAFVFSFGVVAQFKLGHMQTYTVQLAPLLGCMLVAAWDGRRRASRLWAAAAGLLVGLMFFTAAQTPWFLGLQSGLVVLAGLAFGGWRYGWRDGLWRRIEWRLACVVAGWFALGFVIGLVPFVVLYRHSLGLVRTYDEVRMFSAWMRDPLNIPPGELLWFELLKRAGITGREGRQAIEVALGLTPAFAVAGVLFLIGLRSRPAVRGMLLAGLIGPLLTIDFWGIEPWKLVYRFVPGGRSVRTPFRIELAAQFFLLLGLALGLACLVRAPAWRRSPWLRVAAYAGVVLLLAEQLGDHPSSRDSRAMEQWLDAAHRPAFACTAFYLLPSADLPWQDYQSDAMLLSEKLGMPTLNGNSSFYPRPWDLSFTDPPGPYSKRALEWIDLHGIRDQVCGVNPRRGTWVQGVAALQTD